ncbi:MAG TPA: carbon-nitrogen hydrolase family protein [Syntrophobacter fumaroxidans]|nr:carbon-nitrogen hydrolase family protein [Syntrophobacter fumaroxidans]
MKDHVRIAIIQPKPYPLFDDPRNLGHALQLLEKCRTEKLDIICFPEYFPFQGEKELGAAARQLKAYIVAGIVESDGDKLYNTATIFNRSGQILGRQRKRNVGSLERNELGISPGDGLFRAFVTDFGKIGLPVCIDFWGQPEAGRQLVDQGVEIIFNMSVFPVLRGHWKTGAMVRAFDNFVPVVGVNTADYNALLNGRRVHHHGGGSFVIGPPRMLDKDDFRRWVKGLDSLDPWVQIELDQLEQVYVGEVNLGSGNKFRKEFFDRFGFQRPV